MSWARRRPAISALAGLLLLSLIVAALLLWHANQGLRRAVREQKMARVAETAALHDALVQKARAVRQSGRIGQRFEALTALEQAAKIKLTPEVRNETVAALASFDLREISRLPFPKPADAGSVIPHQMTLDAELRTGVFAEPGRGLVWHTLDDHTAPRVFPGTGKTLALQVQSSPDGRWFLAQLPEELQLWRTEGSACEKRWPLPPADNPVLPLPVAFCFSADSTLLARAGSDGQAEIYDLRANTNRASLLTGSAIIALAFDPAGGRLAVVHKDAVEIRELKTGGQLLAFAMPNAASWCAWNSDGAELAVGSQSRRAIEIKFAATGETFLSLGVPGEISRFAFQPGGQIFAAVTAGQNVLLWELPDSRPILSLSASDEFFQFSADGRRLAVGGIFNDLIVYELLPSPVFREFIGQTGLRSQKGYHVDTSWDDKWLVTGDADKLRVWEVRSGREVLSVPQPSPLWTYVAFAPADQSLIFSVAGGGVMLRPLQKKPLSDGGETLEVGNFIFAGGTPLDFFLGTTALGSWINYRLLPEDEMEIWPGGDVAKRRKISERRQHMSVVSAFSPDEKLLAIYLSPGQVDIWRTADARLLQSIVGGSFNNVVFTPDGRWLAAGTVTEIQLLETNTWHYSRTIATGLHRQDFAELSFSPDGKWMVFQETMERYQIRSFPDFEELATLEAPHALSRTCIEWSKDSARLYVLGDGNRLYEWNLAALRAELEQRGLGQNPPKP